MPNIVNFADQLPPAPSQQINQSRILGQLLAQGIPQQQGNPLGGLQSAILQKGAQDALLRQQQQQGVANQVGSNILQNQVIPQGF